MADNPEQKYTISKTLRAADQIREMGKEAKQSGALTSFQAAWMVIISKLEKEPKSWGDPVRHAAHPDGIFFRGIQRPFVVHYVVYERNRKVVVYEVGSLPPPPD
jgi:hypothetical protein